MIGIIALLGIFFVSSALGGLTEDLIEDAFVDLEADISGDLINSLGLTRLDEFIESGGFDDLDPEIEKEVKDTITTVLEGNPEIRLGSGESDTLVGSANNDLIVGDANNDQLSGNAGVDIIDGGSGNDVLNGGLGNDFLAGGGGNDTLTGAEGADSLFGLDGDDVLNIDDGDTATGGSGRDEFVAQGVFADAKNPAEITDFDSEEDKLVVLYDRATTASPTLTLNTDAPENDVVELDGIAIILLKKGVLTLDMVNLVEMSARP